MAKHRKKRGGKRAQRGKKRPCKHGRVKSGDRKGRCRLYRLPPRRKGLHERGAKAGSWVCGSAVPKGQAELKERLLRKRGVTRIQTIRTSGGDVKICHR